MDHVQYLSFPLARLVDNTVRLLSLFLKFFSSFLAAVNWMLQFFFYSYQVSVTFQLCSRIHLFSHRVMADTKKFTISMPYFHFKLTLLSLFVRKYGLGLNPLTPKIWLSILPSSYYTCPRKLIMRIRCSIKVINCTWWVWVFSLPVYCIMYGYFREKLHVNHFLELKVNRIVL